MARAKKAVGRRIIEGWTAVSTIAVWPSLKKLAMLDQYCNMDWIAVSPDGAWFAVCGHEVHVFDAKKLTHIKWSMCASASGKHLYTGDDRNMLRVYDVENGCASADGKWIATANELGTVVVYETGTLAIAHELRGHDPTQPDTGARSITGLAFLPSGELVVGAAPKKAPSGLSVHALG